MISKNAKSQMTRTTNYYCIINQKTKTTWVGQFYQIDFYWIFHFSCMFIEKNFKMMSTTIEKFFFLQCQNPKGILLSNFFQMQKIEIEKVRKRSDYLKSARKILKRYLFFGLKNQLFYDNRICKLLGFSCFFHHILE